LTLPERLFSLLNMRSKSPSPEDLSTKARIRDAAVRRFAADGLGAPLRAIAADAGVSPGLIMHHFGSRAGLRAACDEYVLAETRSSKAEVLAPAGAPAALLSQLAQVDGYAPLIGYVLRCLQAGDDLTRRLIDGMVAEAATYFETGVKAGTITPSRDEPARARLLTEFALGSLLMNLPAGGERLDLEALPAWLDAYAARIILPTLEILTEPLLADSSLLDAYLASTDGTAPGHPED
jgi:AcrR family transcriptional regulator